MKKHRVSLPNGSRAVRRNQKGEQYGKTKTLEKASAEGQHQKKLTQAAAGKIWHEALTLKKKGDTHQGQY